MNPSPRRRHMRITQATAYALAALLQLSDDATLPPVPCSELSRLGSMPERFLLQIMRHLVTAGLAKSTRGVDGGYRLSKPLSQISLLDVAEAIDGPLATGLNDILSIALAPGSKKLMENTLAAALGDTKLRLEALKLDALKVAKQK